MPPGAGYTTDPFEAPGFGSPGTPIQLPGGGTIMIPAGGLTQAQYDALSGVRAGNPVGGPFAQAILNDLIASGVYHPGNVDLPPPGSDDPRSTSQPAPSGPAGGPPPGGPPPGDSPQSTSSPQSGSPAARPGAPSTSGGPHYVQFATQDLPWVQNGRMQTPAYAAPLAQRLAQQRLTRRGGYAAPTGPPPMDPNQGPPRGTVIPRPRGPNGVDVNTGPRPQGGSPPFYPPGGGVPDSQLPTKPVGRADGLRPWRR